MGLFSSGAHIREKVGGEIFIQNSSSLLAPVNHLSKFFRGAQHHFTLSL